jgi:hypothetical protein
MFESTFSLVRDACSDYKVDSDDEVKKWIQAWSWDGDRVTIMASFR